MCLIKICHHIVACCLLMTCSLTYICVTRPQWVEKVKWTAHGRAAVAILMRHWKYHSDIPWKEFTQMALLFCKEYCERTVSNGWIIMWEKRRMLNYSQKLNSQKTSYTSPSWANYEVFVVCQRIRTATHRELTAKNFVMPTGGIGIRHNNNLWWYRWRRSWHHDDFRVHVMFPPSVGSVSRMVVSMTATARKIRPRDVVVVPPRLTHNLRLKSVA